MNNTLTTLLKEVLSEFKGMEYIDSEWREAIRKLESVIASMEAREPVAEVCVLTGPNTHTFMKPGQYYYTHPAPQPTELSDAAQDNSPTLPITVKAYQHLCDIEATAGGVSGPSVRLRVLLSTMNDLLNEAGLYK
jgi:hypothetical protein